MFSIVSKLLLEEYFILLGSSRLCPSLLWIHLFFFFNFILSLQSVSSLIPIIRHTKEEENARKCGEVNWATCTVLCLLCVRRSRQNGLINWTAKKWVHRLGIKLSGSDACAPPLRVWEKRFDFSSKQSPYQSQMFSQSRGNMELIAKNGKHTHSQFPSLLFLIFPCNTPCISFRFSHHAPHEYSTMCL